MLKMNIHKTKFPIEVTEIGIEIDVNDEQQ
jgi:hypothetical protein